jgi:hypothetical protein
MPNNTNQKINYPVDVDTAKKAKDAQQEDNMDNPIVDEEAQNVTDGAERLSGNEAEQATRKANEGKTDK